MQENGRHKNARVETAEPENDGADNVTWKWSVIFMPCDLVRIFRSCIFSQSLAPVNIGLATAYHFHVTLLVWRSTPWHSQLAAREKMKPMMRFSAIPAPPSYVRNGRTYVTRYKKIFAIWRITGGFKRQRRYSSLPTQMICRSSTKRWRL